MQKITLDEFCAHWVREREKGGWDPFLPSRLAGNTFDFATEAGQSAGGNFLPPFPREVSAAAHGRHVPPVGGGSLHIRS